MYFFACKKERSGNKSRLSGTSMAAVRSCTRLVSSGVQLAAVKLWIVLWNPSLQDKNTVFCDICTL